MILKKIVVEKFRNIEYAELEFNPQVNIFYGHNAQGKTNLLEAVAIALGKSFRNFRRNDITPFNDNRATTKINLFYESETIPGKLNQIFYQFDDRKSDVTINSISLKKATDLYGEFKYVVFIPDNLRLMKGYPDVRRSYLDNIAIMQNKVHRKFLSEYKDALKQRCAAYYSNHSGMGEMRSVWDDILIKQGINLTYGRLKYLSLIKKYAPEIYKKLSGGERLEICYQSDVFGCIESLDTNHKNQLYNIYRERLKETVCDGQSGKTPGVHRDDILFAINGISARNYGSQGQLRSIAVSLKLAEAEIIREFNRENPVILLDEVLGELDENRRQFIVKQFVESQVFITSCNINDVKQEQSENTKIWNTEHGKFTLFSFGQ